MNYIKKRVSISETVKRSALLICLLTSNNAS